MLAHIISFESLKQELGMPKSTPIFSNIMPSMLIGEVSKFTEEKAKLLRFEEDKLEKALEKSTAVLTKLSINTEDPLLDSLNYTQRIKKKSDHIFELIKRLNIQDVPLKYTELLSRSVDNERLDQIVQVLEREELQRTSSHEVVLIASFL